MTQGHLKIFVSGSAHLDILSTVDNPHDDVLDRIGSMMIEVGGTAFNVAANLSVVPDMDVHFFTALGKSSISDLIIDELKTLGIHPLVYQDANIGESGFSGHVVNGDLVSAISSIGIERNPLAITSKVEKAIAGSNLMVLDCNHHPQTLTDLINAARQYNVPVAICGVSEPKTLRLMAIPEVDYIFLNRREWAYLQQHQENQIPWPLTCIFETRDKDGAQAIRGGQVIAQCPAPEIIQNANFMGCGDAFAAGACLVLAQNPLRIERALIQGTDWAKRVMDAAQANLVSNNFLGRRLSALRSMATKDPMTGCWNRGSGERMLEALLSQTQYSGKPSSLIFLDIDHFKSVNDTYGHEAGDDAIKAVTRLTQEMIRSTDSVIRWGGEEFLIALPECEPDDAFQIAEKVRKRIQGHAIPALDRPVTVSLGLVGSQGFKDVLSWVKACDKALYDAKTQGRNRTLIYTPTAKIEAGNAPAEGKRA